MTITKRAAEIVPASIDFTNLLAQLLPAGQIIADGDVKVFDHAAVDKSATMLVSSTIGTHRIDSIVQAGTKG